MVIFWFRFFLLVRRFFNFILMLLILGINVELERVVWWFMLGIVMEIGWGL